MGLLPTSLPDFPAPCSVPWSDQQQRGRHDDELTAADRALVTLGRCILARGYRFTTVTPATHRRVSARKERGAATLENVFGWSRSFTSGELPDEILIPLVDAGMLITDGGAMRSGVRFSNLGDHIFAHSAFPTEEGDAVFFGPDTYRFARTIEQSLATLPVRPGMRILDLGAGSGAGGMRAAALLADISPAVVLSDINHQALRFCRINAALNGIPVAETVRSDLFERIQGQFDLILSNPPYLADPLARLYRHGGGELGSELSVQIVEQGIRRLAPGGRLVLYTGSAIVGGKDEFCDTLRSRLAGRPLHFGYEEIDPDVFGEELEHPPYDRADRIAVVGVTINLRAACS